MSNKLTVHDSSCKLHAALHADLVMDLGHCTTCRLHPLQSLRVGLRCRNCKVACCPAESTDGSRLLHKFIRRLHAALQSLLMDLGHNTGCTTHAALRSLLTDQGYCTSLRLHTALQGLLVDSSRCTSLRLHAFLQSLLMG